MAPLTGRLSEWRSEKNFESAFMLFGMSSLLSIALILRLPVAGADDKGFAARTVRLHQC